MSMYDKRWYKIWKNKDEQYILNLDSFGVLKYIRKGYMVNKIWFKLN